MLTFLDDLALKTTYVRRALLGHEIANVLKLPFATVVDKVLEYLRRERLIEVENATTVGKSSYQCGMLQRGYQRTNC